MFSVKVDGVVGTRSFATAAEAEKAASSYMNPKHIHGAIYILRPDGSPLKVFRHTLGDDGYRMWHTYDS